MKAIIFIAAVFVYFQPHTESKSSSFVAQCLKNVYAPPVGKWGQEVLLSSCFGEDVGCKFSVHEKTREIPVRYQTKADQGEWKEYREGTFIKGQVIYVRAMSASVTGFGTTIKADCSCDCK